MSRLPIPQLVEVTVLPPDEETENRRNEFISIFSKAIRRRAIAEAKQKDNGERNPTDN